MADARERVSRRLFAALDATRTVLPPEQIRVAALALIFLEWVWKSAGAFVLPSDASRHVWISSGRRAEHEGSEMQRIVDALEAANESLRGVFPDIFTAFDREPGSLQRLQVAVSEAAQDVAPHLLFEDLLELYASRERLRGGEYYSPRTIRRLLVELVRPDQGIAYDPAAGSAGLLADAAEFSRIQTGTPDALTVLGQEINRQTWQIGTMRLLLRGLEGKIEFGDTLLQDRLPQMKADWVLSSPPLGLRGWGAKETAGDPRWRFGDPPDADASLAWVQHAIAHLSDHGRAALVLAPGVAYKRAGVHIRNHILGAGVLEAVISLPPGLLLATSVQTVIWILRSEAEAHRASAQQPPNVLFVRAQEFGTGQRRGGVELGDDEIARIAGVYWHWRETQEPLVDPGFAVAVPVPELFAQEDVRLDPAAHVEQAVVPEIDEKELRRRSLVRRLSVENLKSIGERAEVDLAPITLIYGPNSAGKTTLIQSLLLVKQSIELEGRLDGASAPRLVTQGELADLGSFGGLIHRHEEDRTLRIGVEFEPAEPNLRYPPGIARYLELAFARGHVARARQTSAAIGIKDHFFATFDLEDDELPVATGADLVPRRFTLLQPPEALARAMEQPLFVNAPTTEPQPRTVARFGSTAPTRRRRIQAFRKWIGDRTFDPTAPMGGQLEFDGGFFPRALVIPEQGERVGSDLRGFARDLAEILEEPVVEFRRLLNELAYLGPLRAAPARFHDLSGDFEGEVGSRGEHVAAHLYWNQPIKDEVNDWLARLQVPYKLHVTHVGAGSDGRAIGDVIAMILTDRRSGLEVSPKDVGFGVSQLLPIVVHLLAARQAITCVEQPEIHVHPRLQAEMADLLIETTSEERGNQVIVETHSEHLILRLQRRIREGALDHERVSVIYVDSNEEGAAVIERLRLDEEGNFIDEWPNGFFDERLDELFGGIK